MTNSVIELRGLSKSFKKSEVLHDFSLSVEQGHIVGLIGPNGAGKTTVMRIIAGIIYPSKGEIELFNSTENLDKSRMRMSFMIESPMLYGAMNAYDNLQYIRYLRGVADEKRINEVLELVGLNDVGNKKVKDFSLGMKQRLGIGMALMTKPEIMILDEPVNGLDPEGIVYIRKLLFKLNEDFGVTIIISSHILSELSELCTDFAIIKKGQLIESISRKDMLVKCAGKIVLKTDDLNRTTVILESKLSIHDYKVLKNGEIHIFERLSDINLISETITSNGLHITKFNEEGQTLENYYLNKIGGQND